MSAVHEPKPVAADPTTLPYASDQELAIPADHVVLAQGRVPVAVPDLEALGVPAMRIGDCDTPRSLEEAVLDATLAVRSLSRGHVLA